MAIGYWLLFVGCWLSAVVYWLLTMTIGHWLLHFGQEDPAQNLCIVYRGKVRHTHIHAAD